MSIYVHAVDLDKWDARVHDDALDDYERERAERFATAVLRRRFLAAHTALHVILAERLGASPSAVRFARRTCRQCARPHGRPYLPGVDLTFSLSHSGDVALVATCDNGSIGADVEFLRPVNDPVRLARHVADEQEIAELAAVVGEDARSRAFLALWVRKEALVKATGEGIGEAKKYSSAAGGSTDWFVAEVIARDDLAAAVAITGGRHNVASSITATWIT